MNHTSVVIGVILAFIFNSEEIIFPQKTLIVSWKGEFCSLNKFKEVDSELSEPKTASGFTIYLKNLNTGIELPLILDNHGKWIGKIKKGTYEVFSYEKRIHYGKSAEKDENCIKWKNQPDAKFQVKSKGDIIIIILNRTCSPCIIKKIFDN